MAIGSVMGYFTGYLNLVSWFPFLGSNQIQVLCFIAVFIFVLFIGVTCFSVAEEVFEPNEDLTAARYYFVSVILTDHEQRMYSRRSSILSPPSFFFFFCLQGLGMRR